MAKNYSPFQNLTCLIFLIILNAVNCLPDQGHWTFTLLGKLEYLEGIPKSLYKDSNIRVTISCKWANSVLLNETSSEKVKIGFLLRYTACYNEYFEDELMQSDNLQYFYRCTKWETSISKEAQIKYWEFEQEFDCGETIHIEYPKIEMIQPKHFDQSSGSNCYDFVDMPEQNKVTSENTLPKRKLMASIAKENSISTTSDKNQMTTPLQENDKMHDSIYVTEDGAYLFIFHLMASKEFDATVDVKMKTPYGYLSAVDWPLLPFYGVMCGIYVIYALAWLIVTALQWRDLLRIQFWIGGVIFLGLIEKAIFYAEYQSINSTGISMKGAVLFAELVSCLKRTLARMLVIIVSLGFGIVKPRLGPMLHRVIGAGALYFFLGAIECSLRVLKPKHDTNHQALMAGIPLAVLDSAICWWIFSSLVQTTRTLRLRRNLVKLSLYQHFTNTLIFSVLASIAFMVWSIHQHKLAPCLVKWKELWIDEAYWHLLFSMLLLIIMILWRPTKNNRRYAFSPLLDSMDENSDSESEHMNPTAANDAFNTKNRSTKANSTSLNSSPKEKTIEDDLKWVEENIPSSLSEKALPSLLDSEEEIMTAKFERNKME